MDISRWLGNSSPAREMIVKKSNISAASTLPIDSNLSTTSKPVPDTPISSTNSAVATTAVNEVKVAGSSAVVSSTPISSTNSSVATAAVNEVKVAASSAVVNEVKVAGSSAAVSSTSTSPTFAAVSDFKIAFSTTVDSTEYSAALSSARPIIGAPAARITNYTTVVPSLAPILPKKAESKTISTGTMIELKSSTSMTAKSKSDSCNTLSNNLQSILDDLNCNSSKKDALKKLIAYLQALLESMNENKLVEDKVSEVINEPFTGTILSSLSMKDGTSNDKLKSNLYEVLNTSNKLDTLASPTFMNKIDTSKTNSPLKSSQYSPKPLYTKSEVIARNRQKEASMKGSSYQFETTHFEATNSDVESCESPTTPPKTLSSSRNTPLKPSETELANLAAFPQADIPTNNVECNDSNHDSSKIVVAFENRFTNQSLFLFWEGHNGQSVKLCFIESNGRTILKTNPDHIFFATTDGEGLNRIHPHQMKIMTTKTLYCFEPALPIEVTFQNRYSESISLFYEHHNGAISKLSDISSNSSTAIATTTGHIFFAASDAEGKNRIHPHQIKVISAKNIYTFQPIKSISATFHNKCSTTINLFWEHHCGTVSKVCELVADEKREINTTTCHIFFAATDAEGKNRVSPYQMNIDESITMYSFEQQSSKSGASPSMIQVRSANPLIKYLDTPSTACSAKFRNLIPVTIDIYDDANVNVIQGTLAPEKEYTLNTYSGCSFYATEQGNKNKVLSRITIDSNKALYLIEDVSRPASQSMLTLAENEKKFMAEYLSRTGVQWRHYYGPTGPRPAPVLYMWSANSIGQLQSVTTPHNYWSGNGQMKEILNLTLEVISVKPKIFMIANFMSDFEVESIINLAKPNLRKSFVGSVDGGGTRKSDVRTSENAWLTRSASNVTETLYLRAAHLLKIDEKLLYSNINAEDIQVVHYVNGQKYDAHYDWGVNGYAESRYITLLLYLTDQDNPNAGGETSFPKADGGMGLKVIPKKGTAVLFYNLLEDGNGDDLTLHAALRCTAGEKWLANFWIWDPKRKL